MRLNQSVTQLNSYLHGELSAVEAYKKALQAAEGASLKSTLEKCERSHESRAEAIRKRILSMGGSPASSSPAWSVKGRAGPELVDDLERYEDQELADYKREMVALDPETRGFVERTILPEAQQTHDAVSRLKKTLH